TSVAYRSARLSRQAPRRRTGRLRAPPVEGTRRSGPSRRGTGRPALSRGRSPGSADRTAQPRHLQRLLPHADARPVGAQALDGLRRSGVVLGGPIPPAADLSPPVLGAPSRP